MKKDTLPPMQRSFSFAGMGAWAGGLVAREQFFSPAPLKSASISRRVERRMGQHQGDDDADYRCHALRLKAPASSSSYTYKNKKLQAKLRATQARLATLPDNSKPTGTSHGLS